MILGRSASIFLFLGTTALATSAAAQAPAADPPGSVTVVPPAPEPTVATNQTPNSSTLPPLAAAQENPPGALPKPPVAPVPNEEPKPTPPPAPTQLKLELANGTSIRLGVLWQLGYEARGNSTNDDYTQNLFLRRFALLIGGTVLHDLEYFIDTDFADLLKAPTGDQSLKNGPGIQTKDAYVTLRAIGDQLKIDGGLMLPAGTHNFLQGGGSIYGWDFFLNTFRYGNAFGSTNNPYGRDVGLQLRGLLFNSLLEYRAGIFQGKRNAPGTGAASRNSFRYAGRVQLNLLDPETNYFYSGTYLGTKKVLSFGASADFQHADEGSYRALGVDGLLDLPVGPGAVTAQVDFLFRNGGSRVQIPSQKAFMAEAGYRFDAIRLSPIARFERRWGSTGAAPETDVGGGLAFWAAGHTTNLKAFYTRLIPDSPTKAYNQFNAQWQVYFY